MRVRDPRIFYGLSLKASPALRARCLAAFDLDPNKEGSLTFGARTHLNLRVKLNTGTETASSTLESCSTDESDVRQIMEIAQLESFDEELFDTVGIKNVRQTLSVCVASSRDFRVGRNNYRPEFAYHPDWRRGAGVRTSKEIRL